MMLIISKGVSGGRVEALKVVLGIFLGVSVQAPLIALGTVTLLSAYQHSFDVLRALGATYLGYLALRNLKVFLRKPEVAMSSCSRYHSNSVLEGFVTNVSNPKVLLFLFAFIPQFADPSKGRMGLQLLLLLLILKVNGLLVNGSTAILSGSTRGFLVKRNFSYDWGALVVGVVFLSISLAFWYEIVAR